METRMIEFDRVFSFNLSPLISQSDWQLLLLLSTLLLLPSAGSVAAVCAAPLSLAIAG